MRRGTSIIIFSFLSVIAIAAILFWAFALMGFHSYLYNPDESQASVIRRYHSAILFPPEWFSDDTLFLKWTVYETLARLLLIIFLWFVAAATLDWMVKRRKQNKIAPVPAP